MSANINHGGPAFPTLEHHDSFPRQNGDYLHFHAERGMTLRDYFAAKAMQSILAALIQGIRPQDCIKAAEDAYFMADAMLKARGQL